MGSTVNLKNRIKEANLQKLKQQSAFKNFVTWFQHITITDLELFLTTSMGLKLQRLS